MKRKFKNGRAISFKDWVDDTLRKISMEFGKAGLPFGVVSAIEQVLKINELSKELKLQVIQLFIEKMREIENDDTIPMMVGETLKINPN